MTALDDRRLDHLTKETVELLQTLIRNRCVNDGTAESGGEVRNADVLQQVIEGAGVDVERYDAAPGRTSIVARIPGTDPDAPSLCLMGHTDVVPVNESGWREDPFGGEIIDSDDLATMYQATLAYQEWLEMEVTPIMTIDDAIPHILASLG